MPTMPTVPTPVIRSSFYVQPAHWKMNFHIHNSFEITLILEGKGEFECRDDIFPIESGHVLIIPANLSHVFRLQAETRFGVLEAGDMPESTLALFHLLTPPGKASILLLSPIIMEQYEGLFRQWLRMISQPLQHEARCLTTWVELLILFLIQHQNSGPLSISVASSAEYIRSNLRSDISIAKLAKQCGLSESQFRSVFRSTYGVSPKQYQQQCRMTEAKWLLRSTNRTIQLIGEQIGFSTVHSFSGWFQKNEGVSPSDWRKIQQG